MVWFSRNLKGSMAKGTFFQKKSGAISSPSRRFPALFLLEGRCVEVMGSNPGSPCITQIIVVSNWKKVIIVRVLSRTATPRRDPHVESPSLLKSNALRAHFSESTGNGERGEQHHSH